ncbi:SusD/RagB family nutrient-binding outer membrane lipoprotein [Aquimarina aquimarini]|uniref:SusD/RagB family nutrient-binding outer membrane lipoprotein n=1 Tax=Aquimarina aquimarini TaxID=1191734 RepID=UPI000D55DADD|nr:SusD/RagB family nutrient-binding outer membrane lipoprotein [Aquimarina aquimarini]
MKKISLILVLCLLISCDLEDTNKDPRRLLDVEAVEIIPVAQAQTMFNINTVSNRAAAIFVQHMNGISLQEDDQERYNFPPSDLNNAWSDGYFAGVLKDCDLIISKADKNNQPHIAGIGRVLMAYSLGVATTLWGDIPYSDAFMGEEILQPSYDTQESIYNTIQELLNTAIVNLTQPSGVASIGNNDLFFGGDTNLWIKTARSLKVRYLMHLIKRDPLATNKATELFNKPVISSLEDQPTFPYGLSITDGNPLTTFNISQGRLTGNLSLAENMLMKSDPRFNSYFIVDGSSYPIFDAGGATSLFWSNFDSPLSLISYTEVKFLEAEVKLRSGDSFGAETTLQNAVRANMEQLGIEATADIQNYLDINVTFTGLSTEEERLEKIIEEKHIALFWQGSIESWTDYRRTGYPNLTPNPNGSNEFDPSGVIPRRFMYPLIEATTNSKNLQEAIARQGNGKGLLDSEMWAFE